MEQILHGLGTAYMGAEGDGGAVLRRLAMWPATVNGRVPATSHGGGQAGPPGLAFDGSRVVGVKSRVFVTRSVRPASRSVN